MKNFFDFLIFLKFICLNWKPKKICFKKLILFWFVFLFSIMFSFVTTVRAPSKKKPHKITIYPARVWIDIKLLETTDIVCCIFNYSQNVFYCALWLHTFYIHFRIVICTNMKTFSIQIYKKKIENHQRLNGKIVLPNALQSSISMSRLFFRFCCFFFYYFQ